MIPPLFSNHVHVYYGTAADAGSICSPYLLSADERSRVGQFRNDTEKTLYITARTKLRLLLSNYLQTEPKEVEFEYGVNGKPFIRNRPAIQFAMTHTGNRMAIGIVRDCMIGLDIEHLERKVNMFQLASLLFSPGELNIFRSLNESERQEAFINCWTRKEAFAKAIGSGLTFPLSQLEVSFLKGEKAKVLNTLWSEQEKEEWFLESFDLQGNYRGAVAVHGAVTDFKLMALDEVLRPECAPIA